LTTAKMLRHFRGTAKRFTGREAPIDAAAEVVDHMPCAALQLIQREDEQRLAEALDGLPEAKRHIIRLRVENDLSFKEIGRLLGCEPNAARMQFCRAVEALREQFGPTE
jgi:RNA polymerase sigma factor (sigma-70 family)